MVSYPDNRVRTRSPQATVVWFELEYLGTRPDLRFFGTILFKDLYFYCVLPTTIL